MRTPTRPAARGLLSVAALLGPLALSTVALTAFAPPAQAKDDPPLIALEADAGIFFAYLSGGITALASKVDDSALNQAIDSIGTGEGVLMRLGGHLEVLGHDVFFQYVSDAILDPGEQAVSGRLGGGVAEDALLFLAGELRPDLHDLFQLTFLDAPASTFVRVEYGRFQGAIEDAQQFSTRNGRPYFGGRSEKWSSKFINIDAGLMTEPEVDRRAKAFGRDETFAGGYFLRYTSLSRPVVLGFGTDGDGFAVQDGDLGMLAVGWRLIFKTCGTICTTIDGNFIPFTGWAWLDLGPFGTTRGAVLAGGFELKFSLPWNPAGSFVLEPYLSFRADWLFPILGDGFSAEIDTAQLWAPDYLLWGPGAGLTLRY
jgi:hypothetical protein